MLNRRETTGGLLKIYSDGGARGNPGPAAAAFVVIDKGKVVFNRSKYLGVTTNNVAEYEGVIMALNWLAENSSKLNKKNAHFFLDSELVVNQLSGEYKVKSQNLRPLVEKAKKLEREITGEIFSKDGDSVNLAYKSVPRAENKLADYLVNKTLDENS